MAKSKILQFCYTDLLDARDIVLPKMVILWSVFCNMIYFVLI